MNCMLVLAVFASIAGSCDAVTWKNFKGKGYALVSDKLDWISAQRYCTRLGGTLAHAETPDVNNFLIASLTDKKTWLWLGGSDIYDKNTWEWQNPLKPIAHDYCVPGQKGQKSENCMLYFKSSQRYKWGSYGCHVKLGFLCQRNINKPSSRSKGIDSGKDKGHGGGYSQMCIKKCMTICLK